MRLFIAIDVPAEIKKDITQSCRYARDTFPHARFSPEENLHITMAFLGEQDESSVEAVKEIIVHVAARRQSFPVRFLPPLIAPSAENPRLILLPAEKGVQEVLAACAADVRAELTRAKIAFDPKPFLAHITLARFDERWRMRQQAASPEEQKKSIRTIIETLPEKEWVIPCTALVLFSSSPGPDGSRYDALFARTLS